MLELRRSGVQYTEGEDIAPSNIIKSKIEKYAEKVASVFDFHTSDDLGELVSKLGGILHYQDLKDWASEDGSIFVHAEMEFDVLLSRHTSPARDRFTVGHELGHYFLHSNQGDNPIVAHRSGSTRIEWEANWFAAGLLMPEEKFKRLYSESKDISRVAAELGVSVDAAKVRKNAVCQ